MKTSIVLTTINAPMPAVRDLAEGCRERGYPLYVIGDGKTPEPYDLAGCDFWSITRQGTSGLSFASACWGGAYARKNVGYLLAIRDGAEVIRETDDDNFPRAEFWEPRALEQEAALSAGAGWVNVYSYFTDAHVWPRGFPLERVNAEQADFGSLHAALIQCPIQQGMADKNPDVDAIYRMTAPLPVLFRQDRRVILATRSWCPINAQNTTWFKPAFPLMYLPATCSIRMTDIWRGLIAQRICWENGWGVLFHGPTVYQDRNEHDLMADFRAEMPGYLHNTEIAEALDKTVLEAGERHISDNLKRCYGRLVAVGLIEPVELLLLEAWLDDLRNIQC